MELILVSISGPLFEESDIPDNIITFTVLCPDMFGDLGPCAGTFFHSSAAVAKDNYYATQFHPEKSGSVGEIGITKFLRL